MIMHMSQAINLKFFTRHDKWAIDNLIIMKIESLR